MVNMECQFGVERRQVAPLLAYIMNKLSNQCWEPPTEETEKQECEETEDDNKLGKRKNMRDLTFVLPSRKSLQRKLEDAAMLNLWQSQLRKLKRLVVLLLLAVMIQ